MTEPRASAIYAIRSKINSAIAPWRSSKKAPPFSTEQLAAMALLSQDMPMTCKAILIWINATFPFYATKVTQAFWERNFQGYTRADAAGYITELKEDLDTVLRTYEFPSYISNFDDYTAGRSINRYVGMELIRPSLDNDYRSKESKFHFFSLPAELRNEIYDMVFQYPTDTGLSFGVTRGRPNDRFEIVKDTSKLRTDMPPYIRLEDLCTRPIGRILEPLLTSRQFFNEAMPMFYRNNHFRFADLEDLITFLNSVPGKRSVHLTHLSIAYPRRDRVNAERAFGLLTEIKHLRVLNLHIEETTWLKYARTKAEKQAVKEGKDPAVAREKFQSALDMPGVSILRSIRGLEEVNVTGIRKDTVLALTSATLKADLTREKQVKSKNNKMVKRKSCGVDPVEVPVEGVSASRKKTKAA